MRQLLITGITGNLGREIIKFIDLNQFQRIYLCGRRDIENLKIQTNSQIKIFSNFDLTDESVVKNLFESLIIERGDELFIIHLIGGYIGGKYFYEYSKEELVKMLNTNFITSFLITKYLVNYSEKLSGATIIFISSKLSLDYYPKRFIYAVSKNALNFLVRNLSKELSSTNITVNAIAPGIILTEENKKWLSEENFEKFVTPEEIVRIINSIFMNYRKITGNIILTGE